MSKIRLRSWALLVATLGLGLSQAEEAAASSFQVSPIRLTLTSAEAPSSGLMTVRNTSAEPIRLQVSAFAWNQNRTGEIQLSATEEIVFYPGMLSLKAGETKNIRVGTLAKPGAAEKTFRLFVEEIPIGINKENTIRVLTRFGVPIFVPATAKPLATPTLKGLSLLGQTFSFELENAGNTHFFTQRVRVRAENSLGGVLAEKDLPAWYMLAGGIRDYTFDLPKSACGAERLVVSVDSDASHVESTLPVNMSTCNP